jgi:TetR/AcrR family transcriptional regulator, transcriptional repressor of bet genes
MPKQVDHEERRRHITDALLRIAGSRGLEAVSLREVAYEAGIPMGAVQHYFASKDAMLIYALEHWAGSNVNRRFTGRVVRHFANLPNLDTRTVLRAVALEYLPYDEESSADVRVQIAFLSRAVVEPRLAELSRPAYAGFVGAVQRAVDAADPPVTAADAAPRFCALLEGLRMPVLVGALAYDAAIAVVDRYLDDLLLR